jgi:uncharacterized membrane protein
MIGWILLATMVVADAGSDVLMSRGTKQVAQTSDLRSSLVANAVRNLSLITAVLLAAIHFGAFLALLSLWDLSLIIPVAALDYALVTVAARFLIGEPVDFTRWAGVGLIAAGVAITSAT